ncbi:DUF3039 domain-containing protein [Rothia sp. HC945]|nr:DUF3039 domain-containing protein [Kocuria sp.]
MMFDRALEVLDTSEPLDDTGYGTTPGGGTATIEREETRQFAEPGDHERFAHYVRKEKIMESALSGDAVIALCGKVWTPGRDPERFPVCPECKEIYESMRGGDDNNDNDE